MEKKYYVIWDISDATYVKKFDTRKEALSFFVELCEKPDVIQAHIEKDVTGLVTHRYVREDLA